MNLRTCSHGIVGGALALVAALLVSSANAARTFPKVTNVSPNPTGTNEFYLTATNLTVTNIGGTNVQVEVYMDDPPGGGGAPAGLPCPMIEANVGATIICHFKNNLNANNLEGASVHWHGIELNNNSDGTAITQDSVFPGQTYVYQFIVPRPGLYWYHSHMLPGTTTFDGMYGPIIVTSNIETTLVASNILPSAAYTFPLVMSDISFTNGVPGKVVNGVNYSLNTLFQLCENYALGLSSTNDQPYCGPGGTPGNIVLVNGYPPALAGSLSAPTANSAPIYSVANNSRVRLQLFDAATSRDFYLSLRYPSGAPAANANLYRMGGQGGLLDNAILDGGAQANYNFNYNQGSIVLGSGMRADVMFYPSGTNGEVIQLVGNPLPAPWNLSGAFPSNYPIAYFVITNTGSTNAPLANGSPILAGTGFTNESLKTLQTNAMTAPPSPSDGVALDGFLFSAGEIILLNTVAANATTNSYTPNGTPNIDLYAGTALDGNMGSGTWTNVPHPPSALWARVGDVLQLVVINDVDFSGTGSVHPFHLHGFAMQPMYICSSDLATILYTFNYNEFLDTIEVYPGQAVVFRVHLTDRPTFADTATGGPVTLGVAAPSGGAVGRWLMHCHIFLHATIGMISELNVVANTLTRLEGPAAGNDSAILAGTPGVAWTAKANASWLHLTAPNKSGTGSANIVFTYDTNPGATRTGSLTLASETINVTQAGSTYVQAPGPLTVLGGSAISDPVDVALDASGSVYIADSGNGKIQKWAAANNAVSTLISGVGDIQSMTVDALGNVYYSVFGNNSIMEWPAATHTVTPLSVSGMGQPEGVAVDRTGTVYIADPGNNTIWAYSPVAGNSGSLVTTGLKTPYGVAVDIAGNVYIADTGNNAVKEWIATNNTVITLVSSGLNSPTDLAVDGAGDVYIADGLNGAIKKWSAATKAVTTLVSGLGNPTGVAVDGSQNVYIADFASKVIDELPQAFVDPTPINEASGAAVTDSVPVVVPATANLLKPFAPSDNTSWLTIGDVTNGVVDFEVNANAGSARSGLVTVLGENITITQQGPSYALGTSTLLEGPASGSDSVVLDVIPSIAAWSATSQASWLHLSTANKNGTGSTNVIFTYDANSGNTRTGTLTISGQTLTVTQAGSTYVQAPGPLTVLAGGLDQPDRLAVDGAGNVYFSDREDSAVKKWTAANNKVTALVTNGLVVPSGVAVDGAGNVYIADTFDSAIKEWTVADGNVITLISNGLTFPLGLALDGAGNIYISDAYTGTIAEWTVANSNLTTLVSGLTDNFGLAVDAAGNVYIAESGSDQIQEWIASSGNLITLISGVSGPQDVAVDGSGNVYFANSGNDEVKEWTAATRTVSTVASGLGNPTGVAVDGSGNVYFADNTSNNVQELPYAFVDPSPINLNGAAVTIALPVVLPDTANLLSPFAPSDNTSWLTIAGITTDVVNVKINANNTTATRTGNVTVLGQNIPVTQAGVVPPPKIINAKLLSNGVFQFGFTNANLSASFSVLFSTNAATPLANWAVIGTASNISPGVLQFTDTNATNTDRFYMIRSP